MPFLQAVSTLPIGDGYNRVKNPSFEASTLTDWTAMSGITASVDTDPTYVVFGVQSMRFQCTSTNTNGVYGELDAALSNAQANVTFYVRGTQPTSWRIGLGTGTSVPANAATATSVETLGSVTRYHVQFGASDANGATRVFIVLPASGSHTADCYIDGVQVEQNGLTYSTYIDGDQGDGYEWSGQTNASKSTRFAWYNGKPVSGGVALALDDDSNVICAAFTGIGAPGVKVLAQENAVQPGGIYQHTRFPPRSVVLTLTIIGSSYSDMLDKRAQYIIDRLPLNQPFELRYTRGSNILALWVVYEGGFEFQRQAKDGYQDRVNIRLTAYDNPMWRLIYTQSLALTLQTVSASIKPYLIEQIQGVLSYTDTSMTIRAMVNALDKTVYLGGSGGSHQVKRRTLSGTIANIAAVTGGGATVYALAASLDGQYIYIAGDFTNCGGTAANYIARYNTSTGVFSALSTGANGIVYALSVSPYDGKLYIGGAFTTLGGVTVNRIGSWDGSSFAALKSGVSGGGGVVYALDTTAGGDVLLGGDFTAGSQAAAPSAPTLGETTGGLFVAGIQRYYKLAALTGSGESALSSSANFTLTGGNTAFTLSWSAVTNATGYNIYRCSLGRSTAAYYLIGTTTGTSFTDIGYPDGVKAVAIAGSVSVNGSSGGDFSVGNVRYYKRTDITRVGESQPGSAGNDTLGAGEGTFNVSWGANVDALSYNVWRSATSTGTYFYVGNTTTNSFADTGYSDNARTLNELTPIAGSSSYNVARYSLKDAAFYNVGTTGVLGGAVYAIRALEDGVSCIVGGSFTWADGQIVNGVARFNGATLQPMGVGVSGGAVRCIALDRGSVLIGGAFTSAGGLTTAASLARWVGIEENGAWVHTGVGTFSSATVVYALLSRYSDLLIGTDSAGGTNITWTRAANTAITNGGTADSYAQVAVIGPSSGTMTLYGLWIHNVGQVLLNLTLQASEMALIDLRTSTILSGARANLTFALLAGSSFGSLYLRPGVNTVLMLATGTVTGARAVIMDKTSYLSVDM